MNAISFLITIIDTKEVVLELLKKNETNLMYALNKSKDLKLPRLYRFLQG